MGRGGSVGVLPVLLLVVFLVGLVGPVLGSRDFIITTGAAGRGRGRGSSTTTDRHIPPPQDGGTTAAGRREPLPPVDTVSIPNYSLPSTCRRIRASGRVGTEPGGKIDLNISPPPPQNPTASSLLPAKKHLDTLADIAQLTRAAVGHIHVQIYRYVMCA